MFVRRLFDTENVSPISACPVMRSSDLVNMFVVVRLVLSQNDLRPASLCLTKVLNWLLLNSKVIQVKVILAVMKYLKQCVSNKAQKKF